MGIGLTSDEESTVTVLLQAGKTVKEISKFANIDRSAVTARARSLDLEPSDETMKRAKQLFANADGLTYADVAAALGSEGLTNDGAPVHYLTVATWVANQGWPWGGSEDGDYAPDRVTSSSRSKYTLRMSKAMTSKVNGPAAIQAAATAAWDELANDRTAVVAIAVIRGAAAAGVTDLGAVKSSLMVDHGDQIRSARI